MDRSEMSKRGMRRFNLWPGRCRMMDPTENQEMKRSRAVQTEGGTQVIIVWGMDAEPGQVCWFPRLQRTAATNSCWWLMVREVMWCTITIAKLNGRCWCLSVAVLESLCLEGSRHNWAVEEWAGLSRGQGGAYDVEDGGGCTRNSERRLPSPCSAVPLCFQRRPKTARALEVRPHFGSFNPDAPTRGIERQQAKTARRRAILIDSITEDGSFGFSNIW